MHTLIHQDGRVLTVSRTQDVEPILEDNKRLAKEPQSRPVPLRHVARIPNVVLEKWLNEERARGNRTIQWGSDEMRQLVARKLADPEWRYLRVDKGPV